MKKDDLRDFLTASVSAFSGEIVSYAGNLPTEKRPWKKKKSLLDVAFDKSLKDAEKDRLRAAE